MWNIDFFFFSMSYVIEAHTFQREEGAIMAIFREPLQMRQPPLGGGQPQLGSSRKIAMRSLK